MKHLFADMRIKIMAGVGAAVLAAVLAFIAWHVFDSYSVSQEKARRLAATNVTVQVAEVGRRDIVAKYALSGKLEPAWTVDVSPLTEGRVIRLLVSEGDVIGMETVVAVLDTRELAGQVAHAEANALAARGALAQAESDLRRSESLIKLNAVSIQTLENDRSKRDIAQAQVQAAEANAATTRARLAYGSVQAHRSGIVTKVYASEGGYARPGVPIVNIAANRELIARIPVSSLMARELAAGALVQMKTGQHDGRAFAGKVQRVVASADSSVPGMTAIISFVNPDGALKAGMTVSGELSGQVVRNVDAIPAQAIIAREGRQVVFVITKEGVTDQRTIKTGVSDGVWVQVLDGIDNDQERVVVSSLDRMQDGMRVTVK